MRHAVMAGQITPTNLFRVRMDGKMLEVLKRLRVRNALRRAEQDTLTNPVTSLPDGRLVDELEAAQPFDVHVAFPAG